MTRDRLHARRGRRGRGFSVAAAVALVLVLIGVAPPAPSPAALAPITAGAGLDWGLKASWRDYIGDEGISLSEGAERNPDGTFHLPVVSGTYDPDLKETTVRFAGRVEFVQYCSGVGAGRVRPCILDITLRNLRVVLGSGEQALHAEVAGPPDDDGELVFTDMPFAFLDIDGVQPDMVDGTTRWTALPATLSGPAAGIFTYTPGQVLDPVTFAYDGPGGVPTTETWVTPGVPIYAPGGDLTAPSNITKILVDHLHDEVYVLTAGTLLVVDPTTMQEKGRVDLPGTDPAPGAHEEAILDPASRTVFDHRSGEGVVALTWDGTEFATEVVPGTQGGAKSLAYDPSTATLYQVPATMDPLTVAQRGDDGWSVASHPTPADIWYRPRALQDIFIGRPGEVLISSNATYDGTSGRLGRFTFEDGQVGATRVSDIQGAWNGIARVSDTEVWLSSYNRTRSMTFDGTEWTVGPILGRPPDAEYGPVIYGTNRQGMTAYDPIRQELYVTGNNGGLGIFRHGAQVGDITLPGIVDTQGLHTFYAALDGDVFTAQDGPVLQRFTFEGYSLSITEQPTDQVVVLDGDAAPTATFTAAFELSGGAATYRWQVRTPANPSWVDVPGGTAPSLTVTATAELHSARYRVVATNPTGSLASGAATLVVHVPPAVEQIQGPGPVAVGQDAQLLVMPTGNPYPEITWQRWVAGAWVDLSADDPAYEIEGGFLWVLAVGPTDAGARFRARLSSTAGTVLSQEITLIVDDGTGGPEGPGPGDQEVVVEVPDPGPGELVWSIDGSGPVTLAEPVHGGDHWAFAGEIHPIVVSDNRSGAPAWSISGQVGDFTGGLPGNLLGWSPRVIGSGGGAGAGAPVASGFGGGPGLSVASTLASADAGHATGMATVGAALDLRVPIATEPGSYRATLTITALS